jgi:hypothetical protein
MIVQTLQVVQIHYYENMYNVYVQKPREFKHRDQVAKEMHTFYEQNRINLKLNKCIILWAVLHISVVKLFYLNTQITIINRCK